MTPRWRVVIVDDHAPSRVVVAETVVGQGGQVVGNGSRVEDAVGLVERYRPDATVVAVGLSDGDGLEAARQVMARCPCPLVLLTSRTDPDVAARAVAAGVLGFLAKPLRPEELGPALDLAVSRFRELEAVRKENEDLKRRLESRRLVDRAKALLIQHMGLTEAEAHRRLQKRAMDTRRPIAAVAEAVLFGAEPRGARPIR
jgi:AmiR/NasT family two-component response regulator